jgi:DNA-binding response OmpR family regulator
MKPRDIIMVVDDSPATLGLLNETMEEAGFTVLIAQSGASALGLLARATPDLVLMDAIMPGMDGFETARRMRGMPMLDGVPIVFMTGLSDTEDVIRGLEAGGVDYVTKPVSPNEVVARIRVHLANARLTRSAKMAMDAAGRFLLAVDRLGSVRWSTPQAARLLERASGTSEIVLPDDIRTWAVRAAADPQSGRTPVPLTLPGIPTQVLEISYVGQIGPDEFLLRVISADAAEPENLLKERLGVTRREAEVLLWLGRGKSNRDIGEILQLSPRTVNKHLEQIFTKLGVENRTAATAVAMKALQG